jgi:hypothetical protein
MAYQHSCMCGQFCDCNCGCSPLGACACEPGCKCTCPCANKDVPKVKLSTRIATLWKRMTTPRAVSRP